MSRYEFSRGPLTIVYGSDHIDDPGYFFQVFDSTEETDENEEGIVINEGFIEGIPKERMLSLMDEYGVGDDAERSWIENNQRI